MENFDWEEDFEKVLKKMSKEELIEILQTIITKSDALEIMYEYWKKRKIV